MKRISCLLLLILLNIQTSFSAHSLTCNVENFKVNNVKLFTKISTGIEKASVNFMLNDSYWNISIREFDKSEKFFILKGLKDLTSSQSIHKKLQQNFSHRLKNEIFYLNRLVETNPFTLAHIKGQEFVIEANFLELHDDSNKNEELFIISVASKKGHIYFAQLHVNHVNEMNSTIQKAKKIMKKLFNTCMINETNSG